MRYTSLLAAMLVLALLMGCDSGTHTPVAADKPLVLVSIHPLASLTRELAGDDFEVATLLPTDASPHGFDLRPAQRATAARAKLVVMVGMGLDDWAARSVGQDVPVLRFAQAVEAPTHNDHDSATDAKAHADEAPVAAPPVAEAHAADDAHDDHANEAHDAPGDAPHAHAHDHSGPNPHLWLDPVLAKRFVVPLAEELTKLKPDLASEIAKRAQAVLKKLEALDVEYRRELTKVPVKELVTFHNAFDLLAERYGLEVVGHLTPVELGPGAEITPRRLQDAIDQVASRKLKVVYAEPQFPRNAIDAIGRATGARVLILDPLGSPNRPGYEDYFVLMRSNLATLVKGQSGKVE